MADLANQKRLAAAVMKVGQSRIRIDPDRGEEVASAVTRADIRKLVSGGVITSVQKAGVSRGRGRKLRSQKAKGRRTGPGSRKGAANARPPSKGDLPHPRPARRAAHAARDRRHRRLRLP